MATIMRESPTSRSRAVDEADERGERDTYSSVLKRGLSGEEDVAALPAEWVREEDEEEAGRLPFRIATHLTAPERDPAVNRYGVAAGQGEFAWEPRIILG